MKKHIVSKISHALRDLPDVKMVLRVGLKRDSPDERIDILIGCKEGDIYKHAPEVQSVLTNLWPNGNFSVCDDCVRFDIPEGNGGIAVCDPVILSKQIAQWMEGKDLGGQHRPWAIGYWLPEALCGDLATAESLYDAEGYYAKIQKRIAPYPLSLSEAISTLCVEEIRLKLAALKVLLRGTSTVEAALCLSDIVASLIRLAFTRSRCYFRGFKSLQSQIPFLNSSNILLYELAICLSQLTPNDKEKIEALTQEIGKLLTL